MSTIAGSLYLIKELSDLNGLSTIECFAFGALISATDSFPVLQLLKDSYEDVELFQLISGESILNNATAILFYKLFVFIDSAGNDVELSGLIFLLYIIGTLAIGFMCAAVLTLILKNLESNTSRFSLEAGGVILCPWVAYLISEAVKLPGLLAILFCGIFMARYTHPNLSDISKAVVSKGYSSLAASCELIAFIFTGYTVLNYNLPYTGQIAILAVGFFCTLLGRGIAIFVTSKLFLACKSRIDKNTQVLLFLSQIRGALGNYYTAFGLAANAFGVFKNGEYLLAMAVAYGTITVILVSIVAGWLINGASLRQNLDEFLREENRCLNMLRVCFTVIDERFLYPFFVKPSPDSVIMSPKFQDTPRGYVTGIQLKSDLTPRNHSPRQASEECNISEVYVHSALTLN